MLCSKHVQLLSFMNLLSLRSGQPTHPTLDACDPSGPSSPQMSSHHPHPRSNSLSPKATGMVSADDARFPSYTDRHIPSHHHSKYVSP